MEYHLNCHQQLVNKFMELEQAYTGFLLRAGNRLILPSIYVNVTGYRDENCTKTSAECSLV